jgi:hypothetical protein
MKRLISLVAGSPVIETGYESICELVAKKAYFLYDKKSQPCPIRTGLFLFVREFFW